jgi:hypothetical protein
LTGGFGSERAARPLTRSAAVPCYETSVSVMLRAVVLLLLCCAGCASSNAPDAGKPASDAGFGTPMLDAACTYDPNAGRSSDCPNDAPSGCPSAVPSYASTVAPVIEGYCQPCHRSGGMAFDRPFDTYARVYKVRGTILQRVSNCIMPPACAPQLGASQRRALLQWLVCGAPDN